MTIEDGRAASKTCHSCGYFWPLDGGTGERGTCHRYPPAVRQGEADAAVFARVGADDWCGEWGPYSLARGTAAGEA